jgi:protein MpaA
MKNLMQTTTKLGNIIELVGEPCENNSLIIGVFHGDEPQGKFLIEEYLTSTSKSKISQWGEDINFVKLSKNLRNNMTQQEIILWQYLKNKQIQNTKFRRQQRIGNYICDFVSFEKKLIIELDGSQHNRVNNIAQDKIRDDFLSSKGFSVLRFWNNEIDNNINGVLEKIIETINSCPPLEGGPKSLISRWGQLFIPCLNPDGMQLGQRTNANGVDLNRNFPTKNWGEDTSQAGNNPTDYYGGTSPASEIETKFLIDVIEKYNPKTILTLHAPYKVVNYDGPAKELAQKISKIIGYPTEGSIGYPTPGSFGTWAGVERQIPTITLELDEICPVENLIEPVFEIFDLLKNPKTQTK